MVHNSARPSLCAIGGSTSGANSVPSSTLSIAVSIRDQRKVPPGLTGSSLKNCLKTFLSNETEWNTKTKNKKKQSANLFFQKLYPPDEIYYSSLKKYNTKHAFVICKNLTLIWRSILNFICNWLICINVQMYKCCLPLIQLHRHFVLTNVVYTFVYTRKQNVRINLHWMMKLLYFLNCVLLWFCTLGCYCNFYN